MVANLYEQRKGVSINGERNYLKGESEYVEWEVNMKG